MRKQTFNLETTYGQSKACGSQSKLQGNSNPYWLERYDGVPIIFPLAFIWSVRKIANVKNAMHRTWHKDTVVSSTNHILICLPYNPNNLVCYRMPRNFDSRGEIWVDLEYMSERRKKIKNLTDSEWFDVGLSIVIQLWPLPSLWLPQSPMFSLECIFEFCLFVT